MSEKAQNRDWFMPIISIIIPLYNGESYIKDCLEKLLELDLSCAEVIIVDDGSIDKSYDVCKQMIAGNDHVKIVRKANAGLSEARNTGLKLACGSYVVLLDSDDELLVDGWNALYTFLMCNALDVLVCKFALVYPSGKRKYPTYSFPKDISVNSAKHWIYCSCPDSIWNAWRYVCRREFLLENDLLFKPGLFHEDVDWSPRVLETALDIRFLDIPFYGYTYKRKGSIMNSINIKRLIDLNRTVLQGFDRYKDKPYAKDIEARLRRESFLSIADYCMIKGRDRCELRVLYRKIWGQMPLYLLSWFLFIVKLLRNAFIQ